MRTTASTLSIALSLTALFTTAAVADQPARPNVILCMTDDQGWGDVSYNGLKQVQTPNLDAMASAGLRFHRFYAAAPVCSPTRGSVMTGRHPHRYGCFAPGRPLRPQERTGSVWVLRPIPRPLSRVAATEPGE